MFCKKCGEKLPDNIKFCSKCGESIVPVPPDNKVISDPSMLHESKPLNEVVTPVPKKIKKKSSLKLILSIFFGIFAIIVVCAMCSGESSASNDDYIIAARYLVRSQLKAPSTAVFSDETVEETDDYGRVIVSLTVDSQNSFGAMLRRYAIVAIQSIDKKNEMVRHKEEVSVQFYDDAVLKDSAIEMTKSLNDWNEPIERE